MKFEDAKKKMIQILSSSDFSNREDTQDTIKSLKSIIDINKKGFITVDSQEGIIKKGYNKETNKYYEIRERAYINGFMKSDKAKKLVDYINFYTDKIAYIVQIHNDPNYMKYLNNGGYSSRIDVSVSASSTNKSDLGDFSSDTRQFLVMPEEQFNFQKKLAHINKSEDVLYIATIDPKYGNKSSSKHGLQSVILDALNNI